MDRAPAIALPPLAFNASAYSLHIVKKMSSYSRANFGFGRDYRGAGPGVATGGRTNERYARLAIPSAASACGRTSRPRGEAGAGARLAYPVPYRLLPVTLTSAESYLRRLFMMIQPVVPMAVARTTPATPSSNKMPLLSVAASNISPGPPLPFPFALPFALPSGIVGVGVGVAVAVGVSVAVGVGPIMVTVVESTHVAPERTSVTVRVIVKSPPVE